METTPLPEERYRKILKPLNESVRWLKDFPGWWPPWRDDAQVAYVTCECVTMSFHNSDSHWQLKERPCYMNLYGAQVPVEMFAKYIKGKAEGKCWKIVHQGCRYKLPDWEVVDYLPGFYILEKTK